jgi:hypothetical protein
MVTRFAYISFVEQASIGNKTDIKKSVTALTEIWARALGLEPDIRRSKPTRSTSMPPKVAARRGHSD